MKQISRYVIRRRGRFVFRAHMCIGTAAKWNGGCASKVTGISRAEMLACSQASCRVHFGGRTTHN